MSTNATPWLAAAAALALAACFVPPGFYARESFPAPPEHWQESGRYRQAEGEPPPVPPQGTKPAPTGLPPSLENPEPQAAPPAATAVPAPRPVTAVRDRGVVDAPAPGRVQPQEGPPRGLDPQGGRTHIIELYQQAVDERDALAAELEALRKTMVETTTSLELQKRENADLAARVAALESAQQELSGENQALAARLVQAQIRRLEAEKLLLETRLEQVPARAGGAARAAASLPRGKSASE